jgi:hypothetical protein
MWTLQKYKYIQEGQKGKSEKNAARKEEKRIMSEEEKKGKQRVMTRKSQVRHLRTCYAPLHDLWMCVGNVLLRPSWEPQGPQ